MAINKNFVVKNGLEVASNLIVADAVLNKVGVGSTSPRTQLDVRGGFISTDSYVSGISTVEGVFYVAGAGNNTFTALGVGGSVGVGTALPSYLLDVRSPVSTGQTALYVKGDGRFTGSVNIEGDLFVDDITFDTATLSYLNVTGFGTVSSLFVPGTASIQTGIVTFISGTNLNYSGIATANSISIGATQVISNTRQLQNIASLDATTTATIEAAISNAPNTFTDLSVTGITTLGVTSTTNLTTQNLNVSGVSTFIGIATFNNGLRVVSGVSTLGVTTTTNLTSQNLNVSGIATLGTLQVSSGIVTATSGIITYYGDGRYLQNVTSGVGIKTTGAVIGYGATILDFRGAGISTITVGSGIGTINITGGGGGGAVSIGTIAPPNPTNGDLWYSPDYGRTFVWYNEVTLGIGSTAVWVDAAPFNIGIVTATLSALPQGSLTSPSLAFVGDSGTGIYQQTSGEFTAVSLGSSVLNINRNGIRVTGIATATELRTNRVQAVNLDVSGISTFAAGVNISGNTTVGGALTVTGNFTVNGTQTIINTQTLDITDKNIGIGSTSTPSDALADGSGITIYGTTDKTLTWSNTTRNWTFVGGGVTVSNLSVSGVATISDYDGNFILDSYLFNS